MRFRPLRHVLVAALLMAVTACGWSPATRPAVESTGVQAQDEAHAITINGPANYAAIHRLIDQATSSISIEVFNFDRGPAEDELCAHLIRRAKQGIKVRVLIDQLGNFKQLMLHNGVKEVLTAGGVEVNVFKYRTDARRNLNITHRKLYMADGVHALTGGMNLREDFYNKRHDILVEFRNDNVVTEMYQEYAKDWAAAGGRQIPMTLPKLRDSGNHVVVTSPYEGRFEIRDTFYQALDNAQHLIQIWSPYFSDDGMVSRLIAARKRGVQVQIIVPGANPSPIFKCLNAQSANELLALGAEIHSYSKSSTHLKYFAVDGNWASFGSANGDSRAMNLNQELNVIVREPTLLKQLDQQIFQTDWNVAAPVTSFPPMPWYSGTITNILELIDYYI